MPTPRYQSQYNPNAPDFSQIGAQDPDQMPVDQSNVSADLTQGLGQNAGLIGTAAGGLLGTLVGGPGVGTAIGAAGGDALGSLAGSGLEALSSNMRHGQQQAEMQRQARERERQARDQLAGQIVAGFR